MTGTHFLILILIAAAFSTSFYIFASKRGIPKPRSYLKSQQPLHPPLGRLLLGESPPHPLRLLRRGPSAGHNH